MQPFFPKGLLLYATFAILASCATAPKVKSPTSDNTDLSIWKAEGKIGFRSSNKAESANFVWENTNAEYQIQLFGPFGQGRVQIEKRQNTVALTRDGKTYTATSAQRLLEQTTGLSMPVHWLRHWIKGEPVPGVAVTAFIANEHQQTSQFVQGDWLIKYPRYTAVGQRNLPAKMSTSNGDYTVTVVIKSWQM